ncbi:MAG TPA: exosortase/archaeosortase family protein [Verrucomicrobiae bacterium]|nr:exosortase/archaeosortase family protein [Verrucomicrobiae bacterium]
MTSPRKFALAAVAVALLFAKPLFDLAHFAINSSTFSHIILIPFIAAYLASMRWKTAIAQSSPSMRPAIILLALALVLLAATWLFARTAEVRLSLRTIAFVLVVMAAAFRFLGAVAMSQLAFPFAFLFFMVPLPPIIMNALEIFFQHASATAAAIMMKVSRLPAIHDGLYFFLPGFTIKVAQECSGIHSTLVLFITSLIAGYLLLRRPRDRAILTVAIVPLAILRNGFRIFSLAWLSVEVNPDIIDSALHHRGGPIFFALSLIPLFLLLLLLRKLEKKPVYAS